MPGPFDNLTAYEAEVLYTVLLHLRIARKNGQQWLELWPSLGRGTLACPIPLPLSPEEKRQKPADGPSAK